jgi:hypothetical protein
LQSRLLQCMDHSKPPCHLLMLRVVTPRIKRLSLSGFLFLRAIFTIQGAHSVFIKLWLDVKHSTLNRYFAFAVNWSSVFQLPQLHKHFNVGGKLI